MSLRGLEEHDKLTAALMKRIRANMRQEMSELKGELEKVQYLLQDAETRATWARSAVTPERLQSLVTRLNDTEKLYIDAGNTKAARIFRQRMQKQLRERMTNLEANEAELRMRIAKLQRQVKTQMTDGLTNVRRSGSVSELYSEAHQAGGFLTNLGRPYLQDIVTFETKAAGSKTLGQYMSNLFSTYEDGLRDVFVRGIVRGDSYKTMQDNLVNTTGITERKAELLVRTEANAIFNDGVAQVIQENPLVAGYRFRAVLDGRTSKICQEHDGEFIPKDDMQPGVNYPPLHPNCRSTVTTVLYDELDDHGKPKQDQTQRYTKNDRNQWEPVPPGMTYEQYKERFGFSNSTKPTPYNPPNRTIRDQAFAAPTEPEYHGYSKANRSAPGRIEKMLDNFVKYPEETKAALKDVGSKDVLQQAMRESGYDALPTTMTHDSFKKFVDKNESTQYELRFESKDDRKAFIEGTYEKPVEAVKVDPTAERGSNSLRVAVRNKERILTNDNPAMLRRQQRYDELKSKGLKQNDQEVLDAVAVEYGFDSVDMGSNRLRIFNRTSVVIDDVQDDIPTLPDTTVKQQVDQELRTNSSFSMSLTREEHISPDDPRIRTTKDGAHTPPYVPNAIGSAAALDHKLPDVSIQAQRAYDRARKSEPEITSTLLKVSDETGSPLDGIEFDVKQGSSTARKIETMRKDKPARTFGKTDAQIVGDMGDLVRYTYISDHDSIALTAQTVVDDLGAAGMDVVEVDNKFMNPDGTFNDDAAYRAIHISGRTKEGQVFEVQVHSQVSLDIKGKTHVLYEKFRDPATTEEERAKLSEEMKKIARTMPRPKGIDAIKSFKIK